MIAAQKTHLQNQRGCGSVNFAERVIVDHIPGDGGENNTLIKRVSGYFKRNFDYEPRDIVNSPLHTLMPPSIRSFHHAIFLSWVKEGRTNNEECYTIKKIMPLTGLGYLAPSFKFYKYYLRSDSEIEYIAMLKRNRKDEMIILANDKF